MHGSSSASCCTLAFEEVESQTEPAFVGCNFPTMIDVLIHSPFPQETGQGNSVTAERLLMVLSGAGIEAEIETVNYQDAADAKCLVALNAWRSASVVAEFDREHPNRQIVVVVTGSDINHPEMKNESSDTRITMERADMLVTLHDADLRVLPERLQQKSVSIYPSVSLPADLGHRALREGCFDVVMAGNLPGVSPFSPGCQSPAFPHRQTRPGQTLIPGYSRGKPALRSSRKP